MLWEEASGRRQVLDFMASLSHRKFELSADVVRDAELLNDEILNIRKHSSDLEQEDVFPEPTPHDDMP
jgi:hypothetical protein